MPTCRYHPLEPADRVCAPCLTSKLNSLSRREGGIRRFVDSFHTSAYPDEEDLPIFSLHGFGCELEKKNPGGGTISSLLRSESHRESAVSANAFFSCGSEMSTRLSADTHSEVDIKSAAAATPLRKSDSRRYKVEQLSAHFSDLGSDSSNAVAAAASSGSFNLPAAAAPLFPAHSTHFAGSDAEILQGLGQQSHHHHHHHQHLGAFSDRGCISDLITRENDVKYRKPCSFGQNLAKRAELKDPSHSHGICLKTPIWKFKLFSKSSPIWRLGLKGSKVTPSTSKRDVEMDNRGSHKEAARHSNTRRLIASPPDDSVRLWCPSPMVTFKEGSFRWGKSFDKGSGSCRKTGRDEPDALQAESEPQLQQQQQQSSTAGVFRRLFDLTQRRGTSASRSETESTASWNGTLRAQEMPPRSQYDEEQAQLAANILSWMDGAAATVGQPEPPQPAHASASASACSTMAGKSAEMSRFPEPELVVR
ncbi:hypothetical protein MPTK1_1g12590 [Marchantia polymorpha subsp. ruderalis]|uniref:Uncharacterized protein n=2 Tax=Marchantia polymorpha TaxID=3197 RepID=A0AAF6APF3_MARPO|nr:hypothetical protein MARPO_0019s0029 [Marchantia polymorpha]BBM98323.1 hypothetical protein Mp_1g12590 [Marchantia polymorpha subsp. ruderalis]|eukprot:PTQ44590.1 hypothetical protein MARPO_0019s0029 [Marchantia polymorpha]